jgi:Holliday junction resolvase RusA-like endonuclease
VVTVLSFDVLGIPAPQGSKRGFYNKHTGRVAMVESSKKVRPWRQDVAAAAEQAIEECGWEHRGMPVRVTVEFFFPRTKGHFGTGRNSHLLKPSAPFWPAVRPDIDKAARSTFDALGNAGCFADDARIVETRLTKRYADRNRPGARITVELLTQDRHAYTTARRQDDALWDLPPGTPVADATVQEALL